MGKAISIAGWLVFIGAVIGAICRTGPDDPVTASMKESGVYKPVITVLAVVLALLLIWVIREMRRTIKLRRQLDDLQKRKGW